MLFDWNPSSVYVLMTKNFFVSLLRKLMDDIFRIYIITALNLYTTEGFLLLLYANFTSIRKNDFPY